jgi:hypothetical protein
MLIPLLLLIILTTYLPFIAVRFSAAVASVWKKPVVRVVTVMFEALQY